MINKTEWWKGAQARILAHHKHFRLLDRGKGASTKITFQADIEIIQKADPEALSRPIACKSMKSPTTIK
jgi:hypothetical protein